MSRKRLIPKLQLVRSSRNTNKLVVVITKQFGDRIEIGDPISQAKIFQDQAADELIFISIDGELGNIKKLSEVVDKVSEEIFMPLTVGGGVKTEEDFRLLLSHGADKIAINSIAVETPSFITKVSNRFGAQCVVVSIDYKLDIDGNFYVYTNCGKNKTILNPNFWAQEAERLGAGELMLTCIDNDGMRNGIELEVTKKIIESVKIPVIAGGGCGKANHFSDAIKYTNADAICAGSFFAHRDQNLIQTRSQILNSGVDIRIQN